MNDIEMTITVEVRDRRDWDTRTETSISLSSSSVDGLQFVNVSGAMEHLRKYAISAFKRKIEGEKENEPHARN